MTIEYNPNLTNKERAEELYEYMLRLPHGTKSYLEKLIRASLPQKLDITDLEHFHDIEG
jgi:hypothetical protein